MQGRRNNLTRGAAVAAAVAAMIPSMGYGETASLYCSAKDKPGFLALRLDGNSLELQSKPDSSKAWFRFVDNTPGFNVCPDPRRCALLNDLVAYMRPFVDQAVSHLGVEAAKKHEATPSFNLRQVVAVDAEHIRFGWSAAVTVTGPSSFDFGKFLFTVDRQRGGAVTAHATPSFSATGDEKTLASSAGLADEIDYVNYVLGRGNVACTATAPVATPGLDPDLVNQIRH